MLRDNRKSLLGPFIKSEICNFVLVLVPKLIRAVVISEIDQIYNKLINDNICK